jgi:hypothetical protein
MIDLQIWEQRREEMLREVSHKERLNDDLLAFVEGVTAACVESAAPIEQE